MFFCYIQLDLPSSSEVTSSILVVGRSVISGFWNASLIDMYPFATTTSFGPTIILNTSPYCLAILASKYSSLSPLRYNLNAINGRLPKSGNRIGPGGKFVCCLKQSMESKGTIRHTRHASVVLISILYRNSQNAMIFVLVCNLCCL